VDPALPLLLEQARRDAERSFVGAENEAIWFADVTSTDLIGAGLSAVARWFRRNP
jgi:hypothetical protein